MAIYDSGQPHAFAGLTAGQRERGLRQRARRQGEAMGVPRGKRARGESRTPPVTAAPAPVATTAPPIVGAPAAPPVALPPPAAPSPSGMYGPAQGGISNYPAPRPTSGPIIAPPGTDPTKTGIPPTTTPPLQTANPLAPRPQVNQAQAQFGAM